MVSKRGFLSLILIVIFVILACFFIISKFYSAPDKTYCKNDLDCVKSSCCHATSCVLRDKEPNCAGVFCSQECVPGTLDCGQASCKCLNNKCEVSK